MGDLAVELRVGDLPDPSHAAFTQEGGDGVVAEAGAGSEGHELLSLLTGLVYAQAVNGSSVRLRCAPRRRPDAVSGGLRQGGVAA